MGGLFHADAKGTVTRYGENLQTNGVVLSPDEKTLYVTNGRTVAAFDEERDRGLSALSDAEGSPVRILRELSARIPRDVDVKFRELSIDREHLRIEGTTTRFEEKKR